MHLTHDELDSSTASTLDSFLLSCYKYLVLLLSCKKYLYTGSTLFLPIT